MNLRDAFETIKSTIQKVYKDKNYLKEGLDCYLSTLQKSVIKEDPTIEIDVLETSRVKEFRNLSNKQDSEDNAYTRSPIFVIQDLTFVARVDTDVYCESSESEILNREDIYKYEYFDCESSYARDEALEKIKESLEEEDEETKENILNLMDIYQDYKTDHHDLSEVWAAISEYGSGLCKYIYIDKTWFLTEKNAKEHIENRSYRYNKPRIYVKSLIETDFEVLLKDMGFKHYE
jgi:hypothetical protein